MAAPAAIVRGEHDTAEFPPVIGRDARNAELPRTAPDLLEAFEGLCSGRSERRRQDDPVHTPRIPRNAYLRGAPSAIDHVGGVYGLRSWGAPDDEPVLVALTAGDLRWELLLTAQGPTLSHRLGEQVTLGENVILSRAPLADRLIFRGIERPIPEHDQRPALRIVADADNPDELAPLIRADRHSRLSQLQPVELAGQRFPAGW